MGGQATLSVECQAIPWIKLTLDLLSGLGEETGCCTPSMLPLIPVCSPQMLDPMLGHLTALSAASYVLG